MSVNHRFECDFPGDFGSQCADLSAEDYPRVAMSFFDKWKEAIWHVVEGKFNALLKERPIKQDKATGYHYGDRTHEVLATKNEVQNIACNLAWTDPVENTSFHQHGDSGAVRSGQAGTAAVAGSAATSAGEIGKERGRAARQASPPVVEEGMKDSCTSPSGLRDPDRYRHHCGREPFVVKFKWVVESQVAASAAEEAGTDPEAQIMKHIINMLAAIERLRDFCGLDQGNMMHIAAEVHKVIEGQTRGKVAASVAEVNTWMINADNIRWGLYHVLRNWESCNKIPEAHTILDGGGGGLSLCIACARLCSAQVLASFCCLHCNAQRVVSVGVLALDAVVAPPRGGLAHEGTSGRPDHVGAGAVGPRGGARL